MPEFPDQALPGSAATHTSDVMTSMALQMLCLMAVRAIMTDWLPTAWSLATLHREEALPQQCCICCTGLLSF